MQKEIIITLRVRLYLWMDCVHWSVLEWMDRKFRVHPKSVLRNTCILLDVTTKQAARITRVNFYKLDLISFFQKQRMTITSTGLKLITIEFIVFYSVKNLFYGKWCCYGFLFFKLCKWQAEFSYYNIPNTCFVFSSLTSDDWKSK